MQFGNESNAADIRGLAYKLNDVIMYDVIAGNENAYIDMYLLTEKK